MKIVINAAEPGLDHGHAVCFSMQRMAASADYGL